MKNRYRVFSMVIAACALGIAANVATADTDPASHRGMGAGMGAPGMMGECEQEHGMGRYGMSPGMMGGYDMEPGMMRGYGMGRDMMGYGAFRGLNLTDDQKSKISKIRKATRAKHMDLMDDMTDAQDKLHELYDADKQDAAAINKQYKVIEDLRRQLVDSSVEAHNKINDILTKEQREKLREGRRNYGPMMRGY